MVAVRHFGFQKVQNFNGQYDREDIFMRYRAKFRRDQSKSHRDVRFNAFQNGGRSPLLYICLDHPQRIFGGPYHCPKFGWNRYSSFDYMQVIIFLRVRFKMPNHCPKMEVFRGFDHVNGSNLIATAKSTSYCIYFRLCFFMVTES